MSSTTWENMNSNSKFVVAGDAKPWGGVSNVGILTTAKVKTVSINPGGSFDSVTFTMTEAEFGDGILLQSPIKVIAITGEGILTQSTVVFRGFAIKNIGSIDSSKEEVTIECFGYKWYLSMMTTIHGTIYSTTDSSAPYPIGSGMTNGDNKLRFEQFRYKANLDNGGYIQNEDCVFNRGGLPTCCTRTVGNRKVVFYKPLIGFDELLGVPEDSSKSVEWQGVMWTWATILSHVYRYWIAPYVGSLGSIKFHSGDLHDIRRATRDNPPIDFSLEGMNPMQAIDTVVTSMPGRWYWYIDYSNGPIRIRIRQHGVGTGTTVNLRLCPKDNPQKFCETTANVESANFTEDVTASTKYVIALGERIKLVSTVKLIPGWPTFNGKDFQDESDFENWKYWMKISEEGTKKAYEDKNKDRVARFKKIYKEYLIPLDGEAFSKRLVKNSITMAGGIEKQYGRYSKNVLDYFFKKSHIVRQVSAPLFSRMSDSVKVFLHDDLRNGFYYDGKEVSLDQYKKFSNSNIEEVDKLSGQAVNDFKWVIPEDQKISYNFDEKNGRLTFETPQFERYIRKRSETGEVFLDTLDSQLGYLSLNGGDVTTTGAPIRSRLEADSTVKAGNTNSETNTTSHTKKTFPIVTRDVYLTGTFASEAPSVYSDRAAPQIETTAGAPFTKFLDAGDESVIIHDGAFYPMSFGNTDKEGVTYRDTTMDGHVVGSVIMPCDKFENYNKIIGSGGENLIRQVDTYLENYQRTLKSGTATLPYMEIGYNIGDRLYNIVNSRYTNLDMSLESISYEQDGDTDNYKTTYGFSNQYAGSEARSNNIQKKSEVAEAYYGNRIHYKFDEEQNESGRD